MEANYKAYQSHIGHLLHESIVIERVKASGDSVLNFAPCRRVVLHAVDHLLQLLGGWELGDLHQSREAVQLSPKLAIRLGQHSLLEEELERDLDAGDSVHNVVYTFQRGLGDVSVVQW